MLAEPQGPGSYPGKRKRRSNAAADWTRTSTDSARASYPLEETAGENQTFVRAERAEPTPEELALSAERWAEWTSRTDSTLLPRQEQEILLARRIETARTPAEYQQARNALVTANVRLVASVARRYQGYGIPLEDLIQEGHIGLVCAAERFRPDKGFRFSTYAIWWIRSAITRAITEKGRMIRLPAHILQTLTRIRKATEVLRERLGRAPTPVELSTSLKMTEEQLTPLLALSAAPLSLSTPLGPDGSACVADLIPASEEDDPAANAHRSALREEVQAALDVLVPRERDVLVRRYGLDGTHPCTIEETSRMLRISRERVYQIEAQALRKLRRSIGRPGA